MKYLYSNACIINKGSKQKELEALALSQSCDIISISTTFGTIIVIRVLWGMDTGPSRGIDRVGNAEG